METGCGYGYAQARNWGASRAPRACQHRRPRAACRSSGSLTFSPCSYLPRIFHGPAVVRGTPQEPRRSTADRVTSTLSLCEWLLGSRRLKQKRKLFPGPPPMDASWFPLPSSCYPGRALAPRAGVQAWLRNKYRIPFRHELPTSNFGKPKTGRHHGGPL